MSCIAPISRVGCRLRRQEPLAVPGSRVCDVRSRASERMEVRSFSTIEKANGVHGRPAEALFGQKGKEHASYLAYSRSSWVGSHVRSSSCPRLHPSGIRSYVLGEAQLRSVSRPGRHATASKHNQTGRAASTIGNLGVHGDGRLPTCIGGTFTQRATIGDCLWQGSSWQHSIHLRAGIAS